MDSRSSASAFTAAPAHIILSKIFHDGLGGQTKSTVYSFRQMLTAAYFDQTAAYYPLAQKYADGDGCTADIFEARYWARKAVADHAPDAEAAARLLQQINSAYPEPNSGELCDECFRMMKAGDIEGGKELMRRAALCSDPTVHTLVNMANIWEGKEHHEYLRWRREAALHGDSESYGKLAFMYLMGMENPEGDYSDWGHAFYWMKKCSEADYRHFATALEYLTGDDLEALREYIFSGALLISPICLSKRNSTDPLSPGISCMFPRYSVIPFPCIICRN